MAVPSNRQALIKRFERHLEETYHPRIGLLAIISGAGLTGFLASASLLKLGVASMPQRYGIAAIAGYLVFLGLIRLWASHYLAPRSEPSSWADALDLPSVDASDVPEAFAFSGDGGFSGGGADRAIGHVDAPAHGGGGLDLDFDLDEGVVWLVPVLLGVAVIVGLGSAIVMIAGAPALLGEVLLDVGISGLIYRRLQRHPPRHWLHGVLRRTWRPMLAVTATVMVAALIAQRLVPGADSIGDFFR